jgi:hypothetical protein
MTTERTASRRRGASRTGKKGKQKLLRNTYLVRRLVVLGALLGLGAGGLFLLRRPDTAASRHPLLVSEPTVTGQAEVFASTLKIQESLVRYQHDHGGSLPDDPAMLGGVGSIPVVNLDRAQTDAGPAPEELRRQMGDRPGLVMIERQGPARGRVWGIGRNGRGEATVLVRLMPPIP